MPVLQPRLLSLGEAVRYVTDCCGVPAGEAKAALDRAFREYSLGVFSNRSPFVEIQGWQGAEIDWENSAVVGGEPCTINGARYTVEVSVFRQHLDEWIAQAAPASGRRLALDDAWVRIVKAMFGADWIGKLTERERWLIKRYVGLCHHTPSSILAGEITYVGPGGPIVPVNDPLLATEVERARDRLEQMDDQYDQVFEWLEDHGFDAEAITLDLARFERAFATVFAAEDLPTCGEHVGDPGPTSKDKPLTELTEGVTRARTRLEFAAEDYPAPPSGIRTNRAGNAERACEEWIAALADRPNNKAAAFDGAVDACGRDLSEKAFERAWARAARPEWKVGGRRKKQV